MKIFRNLFIVLVMAFMLGAGAVYAEGNNLGKPNKPVPPAWRTETKEKRVELREEWKTHRAEVISEMKTKKMEWKDEMKQVAGDKKKLARTRITVGMMQRAENLSNIADRIQARIEKMETKNADTDAAEEMVGDAQDKLDLIKEKIEDLKESATKDGTTLEEIKADIAEIKPLFKEVHTLLSDAVQTLKGEDTDDNDEDED